MGFFPGGWRAILGHIEAGLRTRDRYSPFPKEINRRQISLLSTYQFAPTVTAVKALQKEGIPPGSIFHTGNTVTDTLLMIVKRQPKFAIQEKWIAILMKNTLSALRIAEGSR